METLPASTWPHPRAGLRSFFKWRRVVPVLVVATVIGVLVYWNKTYTPLELGSSWGTGPGSLTPVEVKAVEGSDGRDVLYLDGHKPGTYTVAFTMTSSGPFEVTLLGLTPGQNEWRNPAKRTLLAGGILFGPNEYTWRQLEPIVMKPGTEYYIGIQYRVKPDACEFGRGGTNYVYDRVTLETEYLGRFHRDTRIDLPRSTVVVACDPMPAAYDARG